MGASSGYPPAQKPPHFALYICAEGCACAKCAGPPSLPLRGRVWRVLQWPNLSRWLFSSVLARDSGPLACSPGPQPKRYPACRKFIFKKVSSGRPKAGVGPLAVSGAAASCQQSRQHEGKGRRDGRLLLSGQAPLEPQPHCMQQLFLLSYRVPWDGSGTWWGFGGPMLRDPPPSKDELSSSCTQQRTRRCTRLLRSRLPLLQWYVSVAPSRVTDSACQKRAFGCALARCLPCCAAATLSPFLLLPCPLRFGPGSLCVL